MRHTTSQRRRGNGRAAIVLVVGAMLLIASRVADAMADDDATIAVESALPDTDWNARFEGDQGWIGGDAAYSAVLSPHRVLWLFGDTLLGTAENGKRAGAKLVNNTLGLYDPRAEHGGIRFLSGPAEEDRPTAFLRPDGQRGWFWPQGAIRLGERAYLFLAQIDKTADPGVFGFQHVGQWLAIVENPDDPPGQWRVEQKQIPFAHFGADEERSWGSALLADGDWVYVYGYHDATKKPGQRRMTVARVARLELADFAAWRFRGLDEWTADPAAAAPLVPGLATEYSVTALSPDGFLAVYTENGLGDKIVGRRAYSPHGPWSKPVVLYRCPEMERDQGLFSYAAKAHGWAAEDGELLVSYCVNAWKFSRLFEDSRVYRPRFVRIRLHGAKQR
ncbi:MAG: DUF4185 domain-containing protein [Pirellulales bacterium]